MMYSRVQFAKQIVFSMAPWKTLEGADEGFDIRDEGQRVRVSQGPHVVLIPWDNIACAVPIYEVLVSHEAVRTLDTEREVGIRILPPQVIASQPIPAGEAVTTTNVSFKNKGRAK